MVSMAERDAELVGEGMRCFYHCGAERRNFFIRWVKPVAGGHAGDRDSINHNGTKAGGLDRA